MARATPDAVATSRPVATRLASDVRGLISAPQASPLLSEAPAEERAGQIVQEARTFGEGISQDLGELVAAFEAIGTFNIVLFGRTGTAVRSRCNILEDRLT
jgi:hypothetical protein